MVILILHCQGRSWEGHGSWKQAVLYDLYNIYMIWLYMCVYAYFPIFSPMSMSLTTKHNKSSWSTAAKLGCDLIAMVGLGTTSWRLWGPGKCSIVVRGYIPSLAWAIYIYTGWWFGTFFIFPYIGKNNPNWLIFFKMVKTTNQYIYIYIIL